MEATAKLRFARISPRKARIIVNLIRGKDVVDAVDMLRFTKKAAAPMVAKLLDSAIANARVKNEKVNLDALFVSQAFADQAPNQAMRRYRPRAQGRATQIVKGMSHITLVLSERTN